MFGLGNPELGVLMLGLFVVFIMFGFPIAFTLMALGVGFGYLAMGDIVFNLVVQRTYSVMANDVLISIPLFIFMGYIIERANILDRLFNAIQLAVGGLPGSLAIATLATCAVFATATGIVGAVVTLMGLLAFPAMLRAGYDVRLSAGVVCAGGCLGILIPPSVMLILYGATAGVSVPRLYAGAFFPGLMLAGLYMLYVLIVCMLNPKLAPKLPKEERLVTRDGLDTVVTAIVAICGLVVTGFLLSRGTVGATGATLLAVASVGSAAAYYAIGRVAAIALLTSFFPLAILIMSVLGAIFFGFATPTEAAAVGALGSVLLAAVYRSISFKKLRESVYLTARTSAMVCWLFIGSFIFSSVFAILGGHEPIRSFVNALQLSPVMFMILAQLIIFVLGWPLEWTEIIVIFVPIFLPLLRDFGIDPLFFGILIALNIQTSFLSPPVAMAPFYLKGVAPHHVTINQVFAGVMPFLWIVLVALVLVYLFPAIALWLPDQLYGPLRG